VAPAGWCLLEADTDSVCDCDHEAPKARGPCAEGRHLPDAHAAGAPQALPPRASRCSTSGTATDGGTSYGLWRKSHRMIEVLQLAPGPVFDYCRCWHCCLEEQRRAAEILASLPRRLISL
jgi:hypothetical protein